MPILKGTFEKALSDAHWVVFRAGDDLLALLCLVDDSADTCSDFHARPQIVVVHGHRAHPCQEGKPLHPWMLRRQQRRGTAQNLTLLVVPFLDCPLAGGLQFLLEGPPCKVNGHHHPKHSPRLRRDSITGAGASGPLWPVSSALVLL